MHDKTMGSSYMLGLRATGESGINIRILINSSFRNRIMKLTNPKEYKIFLENYNS